MRMHSILLPVLAGAAIVIAALPAHAGTYEIQVRMKTPDVRYFGSFTYDTAKVKGSDPERARTLTRKVQAFTDPWAQEYLSPDEKTTAYLNMAKPAYFEAEIQPTADCRRGYVCLSQRSSFSTPLIAGSITDVQARAWSTRGKKADLADFVSPSDLHAFTDRVKRGIRQAPCVYDLDIKLPANYSSFPNWVPTTSGIAVWFPESQFGCQIMEVRVDWP